MKNLNNQPANKVSTATRDKWKHKISIIREAQTLRRIKLSTSDLMFLKQVESLLAANKDLSFAQSSNLSTIYNWVG